MTMTEPEDRQPSTSALIHKSHFLPDAASPQHSSQSASLQSLAAGGEADLYQQHKIPFISFSSEATAAKNKHADNSNKQSNSISKLLSASYSSI